MSNDHFTRLPTSTQPNNAAKHMGSATRQQVGTAAVAGTASISRLSRQHGTSRKFVDTQKQKAASALGAAFADRMEDSEVLFHIPVTKQWLHQVTLSLVLTCHSSYGGVVDFFSDILDHPTCKASVFNRVQAALDKAAQVNGAQDFSMIKVGAHDEIFQGRMPVLVGSDVDSTYTYLLKNEEHRDSTTWGVRLLELSDQGINLDHTIADGGKGLRSGQREAWPEVPCRGDVFHPLYDIGKVVTFLENRSAAALEAAEKLQIKMEKAKKKNQGAKYSRRLGCAKKEAAAAVQLKNDIATLSSWLKKDILSVAGADLATRQELLSFIIDELQSREAQSPHRIRPVRRLLEKQGDDLLCFVGDLDKDLRDLADAYGVDLHLARQVLEMQAIPIKENRYWERAVKLNHKIGASFHSLQEAIQSLIKNTVRASSVVENLNSRLRNYFFLRKTLGSGYLELLKFFLNHRRFQRSARPKRVGKSPTELLTGQIHAHWLELLGYRLFKKVDVPLVGEKRVA